MWTDLDVGCEAGGESGINVLPPEEMGVAPSDSICAGVMLVTLKETVSDMIKYKFKKFESEFIKLNRLFVV